MGVRAGQDGGVQHAGAVHVVGVFGPAEYLLPRLEPGYAAPDRPGIAGHAATGHVAIGRAVVAHAAILSAASRTASTTLA